MGHGDSSAGTESHMFRGHLSSWKFELVSRRCRLLPLLQVISVADKITFTIYSNDSAAAQVDAVFSSCH